MGKIKNLVIDIQTEIERGEMSFSEIANCFEVPYSWVEEVAQGMDNDYDDEPYMDAVTADADALASAGFGTDEDYGYYGEDY